MPWGVPAPRGLTCSKSRRVCVWARGPISRSRRRHVCTKGPGWGWAPGGPVNPLGSAGTGSSSPSPHSPSWEAGREQGRAAVRRAKWLLHTSSASEERHGDALGPRKPPAIPEATHGCIPLGGARERGVRGTGGSRGALPAMCVAPGTTAGTSLLQGSLRRAAHGRVTHSIGGPGPGPPCATPRCARGTREGGGGAHWCLCTRGDARVCSHSRRAAALRAKTRGPGGFADGSVPLVAL